MAAGKFTLAQELAHRENAVLLVQDELLDHLFPGEITRHTWIRKVLFAIEERDRATRLRSLSRGMSLALDFHGNTRAHRLWFRELFERANAQHELLHRCARCFVQGTAQGAE